MPASPRAAAACRMAAVRVLAAIALTIFVSSARTPQAPVEVAGVLSEVSVQAVVVLTEGIPSAVDAGLFAVTSAGLTVDAEFRQMLTLAPSVIDARPSRTTVLRI